MAHAYKYKQKNDFLQQSIIENVGKANDMMLKYGFLNNFQINHMQHIFDWGSSLSGCFESLMASSRGFATQ